MTYDLSTKRIPKEKLLNGIQEVERKRNSYEYARRLTEVDWEERGPNNIGGRTRALMLDPNNGGKLWAAGVSGGLWYNNSITSETVNWNLVDATWASLAVSSITYDPNDTILCMLVLEKEWVIILQMVQTGTALEFLED